MHKGHVALLGAILAVALLIPSPRTTEAATCNGVLALGPAPVHASPAPIVSVCVITSAGPLLYDKDTTGCIAVKGIGTRVVTVAKRAPTCPTIYGALFGSGPPKAKSGVSTSGRSSTGFLRFR